MSSNRSALEILARENIPMTEGELLRTAREMQPNSNGTATAPEAPSHDLAALERVPWSVPELNGEADDTGALPGATGEAQLPIRRGQQRTPKPWLMALLCRLGIHEGQWAYAVEIDCTQGRECGRCGSVHVRTKHQHKWRDIHEHELRYIGERVCVQVQDCRRCNATNVVRRAFHQWSEVRNKNASERAHRCERCGVVETYDPADYD